MKVWLADTYNKEALIREVERVTCEALEVKLPAKLFARTRTRHIVIARHCVLWIMYHHSPYSLKELGDRYGLDHTSVIHSLRTVADAIDTTDICLFPYLHQILRQFPMLRKHKEHKTYRQIPIDYDPT